MNTKRKVGIILGSILAVLVVGGMGALVLEQGVKAEYAQVNEWRNSEEGMINAFCHSAGINWNTCVNNAMVIKAFDGTMKVSMPSITPGVGYGTKQTTTERESYWLAEKQEYLQKYVEENDCKKIDAFIKAIEKYFKESRSSNEIYKQGLEEYMNAYNNECEGLN